MIYHSKMNFDDFWKLYPRKVAKVVAVRSWKRLTKKEVNKIEEVLPKQLKAWDKKEIQFIPHAGTWLNQKRFDDEIEEEKQVMSVEDRIDKERAAFKKRMKDAEESAATPDEIREILTRGRK